MTIRDICVNSETKIRWKIKYLVYSENDRTYCCLGVCLRIGYVCCFYSVFILQTNRLDYHLYCCNHTNAIYNAESQMLIVFGTCKSSLMNTKIWKLIFFFEISATSGNYNKNITDMEIFCYIKVRGSILYMYCYDKYWQSTTHKNTFDNSSTNLVTPFVLLLSLACFYLWYLSQMLKTEAKLMCIYFIYYYKSFFQMC